MTQNLQFTPYGPFMQMLCHFEFAFCDVIKNNLQGCQSKGIKKKV